MTTRAAIVALAALAAAVAATPSTARAQDSERWNWRGSVARGRTLEVRGISGSIRAEPASGGTVEVTALKHGDHEDPADVRIEVVEHSEGVTICAVYPGRGNTCEPGGGRMNVRHNDVEVDFDVRVPAGVRFEGSNVNGDVEAVGLTGPAHVHTVNGSVVVETTSGEASATTVNGSVRATVRGSGGGDLEFETVNGTVTVALPAGLGADFAAETVNGGISSDFPIALQGRISPRHMRGRIGDGGRSLRVQTVNGEIRLRRLP